MTATARRMLTLGLAASVAAGIAGCGSAAAPSSPVTIRGTAMHVPAADPRPYGTADAAFGLDLLRTWCRAEPRANIVFSPQSLATGLGMAYLGARGGTARAMARALHVPASGGALLAGLHARTAALRTLARPGVQVSESNQVWADPSLSTRRQFLNDVATGYGAGVRRVPLLHRPNQVVAQIDAAVGAATRGHIAHLLAPGSLSGQIGWVLTDALYLHAKWATPFRVGETGPDRFTTPGGQRVTVPFMNGGEFPYARSRGWTAVSLPYRGHQLTMMAMLPDARTAGCPDLPAATLHRLTGTLGGTTAVALPKIRLSTSQDMAPLLQRMGLGPAFSGSADFSGLSPQACCLGVVRHAATLQVGEKGTTATAATAVGIQASSAPAPPKHLVSFDRPYLLVITDTGTGEPLFMARVVNPRQH